LTAARRAEGWRRFLPELPEVETVRRGLIPLLEGHTVTDAHLGHHCLRTPWPKDFTQRLKGQCLERLERRGKYLLFYTSVGRCWMTHLGMSGSFRYAPIASHTPTAHDHLTVYTSNKLVLSFNDPRRFGMMALWDKEDALPPTLARLGKEPLSPTFTGAWLHEAASQRNVPLKTLLLDQATIAGIGNIYASESLYRARLHPLRCSSTLTRRESSDLMMAVQQVLEEAIAAGGSTLRDHRHPSGDLGCFQHSFAVYQREGHPCPRCGKAARVEKIVVSGRSTFFCRRCQR
jgi:formamidopyrimidine-DNA glycosylase